MNNQNQFKFLNKKFFTQIGILIIVLIIFIVGIGILAFKYWQTLEKETKTFVVETQDEIADWKTYRNEKYNVEFNYPKIFNVKEHLNESIVYFFIQQNSFEMFFLYKMNLCLFYSMGLLV